MREFLEFVLEIFGCMIGCLFDLDLGGYSYGSFLTAIMIISVFISAVVIRFRSDDMSPVKGPPKSSGKSGKNP